MGKEEGKRKGRRVFVGEERGRGHMGKRRKRETEIERGMENWPKVGINWRRIYPDVRGISGRT